MNIISDNNEQYYCAPDVIKRLAEAIGVTSESALSEALGKSRNRIGQLKRDGSIPWADAVRISVQKNVSLDWLIFGKAPATNAEPPIARATANTVPPSELVRSVVLGVETALAESGRRMQPERKADLVATLVDMYAETQAQPSRDNIIRLVRSAS